MVKNNDFQIDQNEISWTKMKENVSVNFVEKNIAELNEIEHLTQLVDISRR